MELLVDALKPFDDTVTTAVARKEIIDFSNLRSEIKLSPPEEYEFMPDNENDQCSHDGSGDDLRSIPYTKRGVYCENFSLCVFLP